MSGKIANILKKILAQKEKELNYCMQKTNLQQMIDLAKNNNKNNKNFYQALKNKVSTGKNAIIAEIKKASPSKGVLRDNFNPTEIAKNYEQYGATCISVLTDRYFFQGKNEYLTDVKKAVSIPVIRKDFIIDSYQVYEAKAIGADCILLIVACLDYEKLVELKNLALSLKMDVLVEVHNEKELEKALKLDLPMIGINNRNLENFSVCLNTTINLIKNISAKKLIVTESGILSREDVDLMNKNDVKCFLVGEAFMKNKNPGEKLKELFL